MCLKLPLQEAAAWSGQRNRLLRRALRELSRALKESSRALKELKGLRVIGALNESMCAGGGSVVGADERPSKIASPAPSREGTEHGEDRCLFFLPVFLGGALSMAKIGWRRLAFISTAAYAITMLLKRYEGAIKALLRRY
jgi:hypothetical protein